MSMTYLNAAGHGLPDRRVVRRMIRHLEREAEIGAEEAAAESAGDLAQTRANAARLLGAGLEETGLASTTVATWLAIVARLDMAGKRVLVAPHEWGANLRLLDRIASQNGAHIERLPPIDFATPDLSAWAERIDEDVAAICTPMVTSVTGHPYPVAAIGTLPRPESARFIVDAAQAVGQVPVRVAELGCDALVATTRKWVRGPRQSAIFWMSPGLGQPGLIEPMDANLAVRLGQGEALRLVLEEPGETYAASLAPLNTHARARAADQGLRCLTPQDAGTAAVALAIPQAMRDPISSALAEADILVKWPTPWHEEPDSELAAPDFAVMRISPHVYNTADQIDAVFDVIARTARTAA
ncbi:MAG: aminotransferase class V-fold PLP-dependent enzyme [Pseudomonadota bacterium]